jgi:alpha-tubulin suppressor-like RCC1 family protein
MSMKMYIITFAGLFAATGCAEQRLDLFDAPADVGADVGTDAAAEAGVDAGPDAEVGADVGVDAEADAEVDAGLPDVTFAHAELCSGNRHSCALVDGALWCWGDNRDGQLGVGDREARVGPQRVMGGDWRAVECGAAHTCALRAGGTVWCWGSNALGQVGRGAGELADAPAQVLLFEEAVGLSARTNHTCAVTARGELWCWGRNAEAELGQRTNEFNGPAVIETPQSVEGFDDVVGVAVGDGSSCVRRASGELWCWGRNTQGQIGLGSATPEQQVEPSRVASPAGEAWASVHTGLTHVCAFTDAGDLYCWGNGRGGQLGVEADREFAPIRVDLGLPLARIHANAFSTCGTSGDGRAWCWGLNIDNLLGVGAERGAQTRPGQLPFTGIQALATGRFHTCLIGRDGLARCVGNNPNGQLGVDPAEVDNAADWLRVPSPWLDEM